MEKRTDTKVHELNFVDFNGIDQLVEDMDFDLLLNASLQDHDASSFRPNPGDALGFSSVDPNSIQGSFSGSVEDEEDEEGENETEQSCGSSSSKKARVDRTRTLVCERKRRGKMKEKLYALRALVPNITKMDKASIVGDAMLYVQHMQIEANKLRAEIADLESNPKAGSICHRLSPSSENDSIGGRAQVLEPKIITQVKGCEEDMDVPSLKMLIIRALINHGFEVRED